MTKSKGTLNTITRQIPKFFEIYTQRSVNGLWVYAVDVSTVNTRIYSCIVLRLVWAEVLEALGGSGGEGWGQQSKD